MARLSAIIESSTDTAILLMEDIKFLVKKGYQKAGLIGNAEYEYDETIHPRPREKDNDKRNSRDS